VFVPHLVRFGNKNLASTRTRRSTKVKKQEKTIKEIFKTEMWLLVDKVRTGGSGKSVDGKMVWYIFN